VIKKLKEQVNKLETDKNDKEQDRFGSEIGRPAVIGANDISARKPRQNATKAPDDLINFLEHKLEEIERKLQKT